MRAHDSPAEHLGKIRYPAPNFFSCSTQLNMKFSLLINLKMPTKVGIFKFISREIFMHSYV